LVLRVYDCQTADHLSFFQLIPDFFAAVFFATGVGEAAVLGDAEDGEVGGVVSYWVIGYWVIRFLGLGAGKHRKKEEEKRAVFSFFEYC
jgi:hypothetical protein